MRAILDGALHETRSFLEVSWNACTDYLQHTWLASHLRLVVLVPDEELGTGSLLYFALSRNPLAEIACSVWLKDSSVHRISASAGAEYIEQAISDLAEGDIADSRLGRELPALLAAPEAEFFELESGDVTPYHYGVTLMIFWQQGSSFHFLELHHES